MTTGKNIVILLGIVAVLLIVLVYHRNRPENETENPLASCEQALAEQQKYLEGDTYAQQYTFEKYRTAPESNFQVYPLDPNSSRYASEFRTKLKDALNETGINFAGHYSLVSVGMTGWGQNYWIVDRTNGHAYEFPYYAASMEFEKDSSLIVMNSKDSIQALLAQQPEGSCYFLNQQQVSDLRPFYFEWKNNTLTQLAPPTLQAPVNMFWIDYLSGIPDSSPEYLTHFIREARKVVLEDIGRIPQSEGYTGFMFIDAFPHLIPEDFMGINTPYGSFEVRDGKLSFFGNAPSNAADMTVEGMEKLLENIAKRLALPATSVEEVDAILARIK